MIVGFAESGKADRSSFVLANIRPNERWSIDFGLAQDSEALSVLSSVSEPRFKADAH